MGQTSRLHTSYTFLDLEMFPTRSLYTTVSLGFVLQGRAALLS